MEYRFLGRTGLRVSVLGMGTMTFGGSGSPFFEGVGGTNLADAQRMFDMAVDIGINLFDSADVYSRGISEEMLGTISTSKRDSILLATKCHGRMNDEPNNLGLSRHHIMSGCEASLRRLKTDHIDLYQTHGFDAYTAWEETLRAFDDLIKQGKVRYIGCSNLSAWQLMKALGVSERNNMNRFVALQANYNLVAREAEHELLPLCLDQSLGFLVWSPLAGGYLTGKYNASSNDAQAQGRRNAIGDQGTIDETQGKRILDVMSEIASAHNASLAQVALNYLVSKKQISSVLIGAKTINQFQDNISCINWSLSEEEFKCLNDVSERPLPYPYWHQKQHNARRYKAVDLYRE
ncbi:MAG: aldo/keto reductase [Alphaproteobacteria bacterium]|nr:aldo/keto reductase [Alphaproteobacteria bacterium]